MLRKKCKCAIQRVVKRVITWLLILIGIILIGYYLNDLGVSTLLSTMQKMPLALSLILFSPILLYLLHTQGWIHTMSEENRRSIGFWRLSLLQSFSYGMGGVIPFQAAFSEPMKLSFLKKGDYDRDDLIASLVIDNTINGIAIALWGIGGVIYLAFFLVHDLGLKFVLFGVVLITLLFCIALIAFQKKGMLTTLLKGLAIIPLFRSFTRRHEGSAQAFDQRMRNYYNSRKKDFYLSLLYHSAEKLHGVFEFWIIFFGLKQTVTLGQCFFIFSVTSTLDNLLFFMQLGGMETWIAALLTALSLDRNKINITTALFRRIRLIFWAILAILFWLIGRQPKASTND